MVDLLGLEGRLVESTPDSERWLDSDEKPFAVVRDFLCTIVWPTRTIRQVLPHSNVTIRQILPCIFTIRYPLTGLQLASKQDR